MRADDVANPCPYCLFSGCCHTFRSGVWQIGHGVQLRGRRQRHLLGYPGCCLAARRYRQHSRHAGGAGTGACFQYVDQWLRRHPGPRADGPGSTLQRRGDARVRLALRRGRSLQNDSVRRHGGRHHLTFDLHQPQRGLGPLARHIHQHHEGGGDHQGRLRRPVGHRLIRRELERARQHFERQRPGHPSRLLGRGCHAARGNRHGRRTAGDGARDPNHDREPVRRRDDFCGQLALRHVQQPAVVLRSREELPSICEHDHPAPWEKQVALAFRRSGNARHG